MNHKQLVFLATKILSGKESLLWPNGEHRRLTSTVIISEPSYPPEGEKPDAIGWQHGISTLLECKASRGDYQLDSNKYFRRFPEMGVGAFRYYLTPVGLIGKCRLREGWGLIETDGVVHRVLNQPTMFDDYDLGHERNLLKCLRTDLINNIHSIERSITPDSILGDYKDRTKWIMHDQLCIMMNTRRHVFTKADRLAVFTRWKNLPLFISKELNVSCRILDDILQIGKAALWEATIYYNNAEQRQFSDAIYKIVFKAMCDAIRAEKRVARKRHEIRPSHVAFTEEFKDPAEQAILSKAIGSLKYRDKEVLCRLYGIGREPESLISIGNSIGVTRERVRQISERAKRRIRQSINT